MDNRSNRFSIERACEIARYEAINDLDAFSELGAHQQLENHRFDWQCSQLAGDQICRADLGNELGIRVCFRVGGVEPVNVLQQDDRTRAEHLTDEEGAGVAAVWRNLAY